MQTFPKTSSANTITESQKIGTGTSSKNDNNERDENKKKNKKSKESKTKRKTKKDNKIIPENFVKMQSHENKSDKDQAEKPSADKDQTVKPSVDKDQTEKPSAAKLRAELLPNLGLPEQKQSEINVIKTTNNIKANLPVEYWQPNNNQLHFYEETFKVADEKGKGKIKGKQAVKFLNKSGLSKSMLRTIWALADYNKVGYLDQQGFLVACRYVAIVQYGVLKDDVEGATLTFEVFQRYMNDDKIPIPKFDE